MVDLMLELPASFYYEEVRNDFTVTIERKKVWAVELDLLCQLLDVCNRNRLKVYAIAGTILGAVRHKGFIPWDDDIDLAMDRTDYIKLCEIASDEFKPPYFFQTEVTDPGSMRCHAQLRNSLTTGIRQFEVKKNYRFNQGIFIDIFPIDNVPDDKNEADAFFGKASKLRRQAIRYSGISTRFQDNNSGFIKKILYNCWGKGHPQNPFFLSYERFIQQYNKTNTHRAGILIFQNKMERFIWERASLEDIVYLPFEMLDIPVPADYLNLLNHTYGDWETPVFNGSIHGDMIFDTDRSYVEYFKDYER